MPPSSSTSTTAALNGIKIIMGGTGPFRSKPAPEIPQLLQTLLQHDITEIDSAVIYGDSEEILGLNDAGNKFTISTKIPGGLRPGSGTREGILQTGRASLQKLKVRQVDILYVHSPDTSLPFEETFEALDELYHEGMFRRLGLSNFKPQQVREVYDLCRRKGWIVPSVYQGNYNAFARSYEQTLLPMLRELGMQFYAYSPQAGGFLSKTSELVSGAGGSGEGRIMGNVVASDLYRALYKKPTLMEGLKKWNAIAQGAGLRPGDMAVRWVRFNSALSRASGDALIIGGRTVEQVEQTLVTLDEGGPLEDDVVKEIDQVWEMVKAEAPVDNYHDFIQQTLEGEKRKW